MRKLVAASALAIMAMSQPLAADEAEQHVITLTGLGYFPNVTHAQPGDTLLFINSTEVTESATANDGSWSTGPLAQDQQYVLAVVDGMAMGFSSDGDASIQGEITFAPPILEDYDDED